MGFSGQPSSFSRGFLRIEGPQPHPSGATLHPSLAAVIVKEWLTQRIAFEEGVFPAPASNPAMRNVLGAMEPARLRRVCITLSLADYRPSLAPF